MSLPLSAITASGVYSHTADRRSLIYRRVINRGNWSECSELFPPQMRTVNWGTVWVRYETVIGGLLLIRSCTLVSFARWAERQEPDHAFPRQPITFASNTPEQEMEVS